MRNFTFKSPEEIENLEAVLRKRKRKVNRQQIVSAIILALVLGALAFYAFHHTYYTEYDGYVHVDVNRVRAPFDIYLDSVYVHPGDIVSPGDTLYSYYRLDLLVNDATPDVESTVARSNRDYTLRYAQLAQQIQVMRVRIKELEKQIATENHNIQFGLSDNSHKLDLERALAEARAQLSSLSGELAVVAAARAQTRPTVVHSRGYGGRGSSTQIYDDVRSSAMRSLISYNLASDSSIITNVLAPRRMVFFEKEEIITKQHVDLSGNNLQVIAYIPVDKMHRINNNSVATIVVNSEVEFDAHVKVLGLRTELIPENLRSYFTKKNTAIIAVLEIDPGQIVPLWSVADGVPVKVRVKTMDTFRHRMQKDDYYWYTTDKSISLVYPDTLPWVRDSIAKAREEARKAQPKPQEQKAEPKAEPKTEKPKTEPTPEPQTAAADGDFYVIVGSMKGEDKANQLLAHVDKTKYPHAGITPKPGKPGKGYLIYVERFASREEAQQYLSSIVRDGQYRDAWIYKNDAK